ncbi:molybdopterin-dependent oxidoreductase [Hydrogenophaga sp.]|uniref:molybdopterin-containing oxidoreductase family protein n=1 Tax=Hydrogenophaga sp. TaxID=1904254 RepID=UPI00271FA7A0|nr:molybdopterin dinucleotide binding domain-containing protein [Hydrogenophaga sp.]MDO9434623.1 molybdopterin-dependent oxidoreductase [Hydrogenophaga sp.]
MKTEHKTFCRYCIATCGMVVTVEDGVVSKVRGDKAHPLSQGHSCPKGLAMGLDHAHPDRLNLPRMRGQGVVDWDTWMASAGEGLRKVREEHGADAIAVVTGAALSSDATGRWMTDRFHKALGSRSRYSHMTVDTPCKPLVSRLVGGSYGLAPMLDHENATLVVLIGMNPVVSHGHCNAFCNPVVQLKKLATQGELWIIDPCKTESTRLATAHMAPVPGTEYALLAWLVRELLQDGADRDYLEQHARGVEALRDAVERYDLPRVVALTQVSAEQAQQLLAAIRHHRRVAIQTGTGVTFSDTANLTEWMTWALSIVTGSYDTPGGMWFNPGFFSQMDQRPPARVMDTAPDTIEPGGPASRSDIPSIGFEHPGAALCDEIEAGHVRAVVLIGNSILTSYPDVERTRAALARLDVLIVAELRDNATTALATHVAPVLGPLERSDVNFYLGRLGQAVAGAYTPSIFEPTAERLPMWKLMVRLGAELGLRVAPKDLDVETAQNDDILRLMADRGRVGFDALRDAPSAVVSEHATFGWVREHMLPGGRWTLAPSPLVAQLQARSTHRVDGLRMVPRRQFRHYNSQLAGMQMVGGGRDDPDILMNPQDAADAGLSDGMPARLFNEVGSVNGTVRTSDALRRGVVSFPHGFIDANVCALTSSRARVDPLTGMVHQGGIPVEVAPA